MIGTVAVALLKFMRRRDIDRSIDFAARWMRRIGPWLPEHRVGRANLVAAFPEKSPAEIDVILSEVWANLGRVGVEFAHLDRLWDLDPEHPERHGRIVVEPEVRARVDKLFKGAQPRLGFTAHLGNWELNSVACTKQGFPTAVLYRTPNIPKIDHYIRELRSAIMGVLVPNTLDAPIRLANLAQQGASIGILVDQHYTRGVDVTFFGRTCKANPLIARLARQLELPIHGLRVVRLPGNRFRSEITEPIEPVRDADGKIDVAGTMQVITSVVESWVREYPEQWLWLHRRWR